MGDQIRPPEPGLPSSPGPFPEEDVLVVPRSELIEADVLPDGFIARGWERVLEIVATNGVFHRRSLAENDITFKQVIPYAVVTFGGLVFLFRRTDRGGEARLHKKLSIGVGGHINPEGGGIGRQVEAGLLRELSEELVFESPFRYRPVGLINDEENPVGQVHIGIVYQVTASDERVKVRETEILEGGFVPVTSLRPLLSSMESWSRLVAESLYL